MTFIGNDRECDDLNNKYQRSKQIIYDIHKNYYNNMIFDIDEKYKNKELTTDYFIELTKNLITELCGLFR